MLLFLNALIVKEYLGSLPNSSMNASTVICPAFLTAGSPTCKNLITSPGTLLLRSHIASIPCG